MSETKKRSVGRPKSYTKAQLERAVLKYFDSITYEVDATDVKGKPVYNKLGEQIKVTCYASPPSKLDLCIFLHIDRGTWLNYCDHAKHPELKEITDFVHLKCEAYLSSELVKREKGVDGIKFNLANNYGWSAKKEVEVGEKTREVLSINSMSMAEKLAMLKAAAGDLEEGGFGEGFDDGSQDEG